VTVNVTVDADEIAPNVAKRLEDEGVSVVSEPTTEENGSHEYQTGRNALCLGETTPNGANHGTLARLPARPSRHECR
jgi:hypothetical protein